jgi:hypothetical protein
VAVVALIAIGGAYIWSRRQLDLTSRGVDHLQVLIFSDMDLFRPSSPAGQMN